MVSYNKAYVEAGKEILKMAENQELQQEEVVEETVEEVVEEVEATEEA